MSKTELATGKAQYFAEPRPIIVRYSLLSGLFFHIKVFKNGGKSAKGGPILLGDLGRGGENLLGDLAGGVVYIY